MRVPWDEKYTHRLYYLSMKNGTLQEATEERFCVPLMRFKSEDEAETSKTNREGILFLIRSYLLLIIASISPLHRPLNAPFNGSGRCFVNTAIAGGLNHCCGIFQARFLRDKSVFVHLMVLVKKLRDGQRLTR